MDSSIFKTLFVAVAVCLVCGILVAASAVGLKDLQEKNARLYMQRNILSTVGLYTPGETDIAEQFKSVEPVIVDVATGEVADDKVPSVQDYDQRAAKNSGDMSVQVPADEDIADIKVRAKYAKVYLVKNDDGSLKNVVLPISGYGLWSTLYGFIALEADLNTVEGLSFYEHAETPGLGGEVDNPSWKAQWVGKTVYNDEGEVGVALVKGGPNDSIPYQKAHYVDALSGATLTSRGVDNLVQYWMGDKGFKSFLENLKNGGVN